MTATTVKVKPLEWPTESRHNGIYRTKHNGTGIYYMMRVHAPNRVSWRCSEVFGWNDAGSEAAAKAAAQADYEARILSAIDTTDLDAHIGAVLAEIDAACSKWADECGTTEGGEAWAFGEAGARILALRPDALTALDRAKREARVEGMRALLAVGNGAAACYPDQYGDVWGAASHAMAEFIETERGTP